MTITEVEVHAHAQALWDAAKKLPDVPSDAPGHGPVVIAVPHPLRMVVEQAITHQLPPEVMIGSTGSDWLVSAAASRILVLRPYDASDLYEPWAWIGRLLAVSAWFWNQKPMHDERGLIDLIWEGDILAALDAAREAVEEVANGAVP